MRIPGPSSSADPKAWRWLLLNLLVLPGLGTIKGGRTRTGGWQLALGLIGFVVTAAAAVRIAFNWISALANGLSPELDMGLVWFASAGLVLFFVSWFWALASSLDLMRRPPPAPFPPPA